jgi:hypothetical protein
MDFDKPATTLDEQIALLRERGMRVIERHGINLAQMGFPSDFQTRPIWLAVWRDCLDKGR